MIDRTRTSRPPRRFEGRPPANAPPQRPGRPRRKPRSALTSLLVYMGLALLVIVVAGVTFLVLSPPTDLLRREIVAQVKAATGRDLQIAGPLSLTLYPSPGISAGDVALSAAPGLGGAPLLTAEKVDVGVGLGALLRQEIAVDRVVLHRPVLALRIDRDGRRSWDMAALVPVRRVQLAQASTDGGSRLDFSSGLELAAAPGEPARRSSPLPLKDVRIVDGTVRYSDERHGTGYEAASIEAELQLPSDDAALDAKGSFVWSREKLDFEGKIASPRDLLESRPAEVSLEVRGRPLTVKYSGSVALGAAPLAEGRLDASADSLRELARWVGSELAPGPGLGVATIAASIRASEDTVQMSDARMMFDGATATGSIDVRMGGTKPHLRADLDVAALNIGNFRAGRISAPDNAPRAAEVPAPATPAPPPDSIDELLKEPAPSAGPQVKGYTRRAAWSRESFDLRPLGRFDADAKLRLSHLNYRKLKVDAAEVAVALKDNVLKATLEDAKLYQGRGRGVITLDGTGAQPALAIDVTLAGVDTGPMLKDTANIDWLAGAGDVEIAVTGQGSSEAAIVGSLQGSSKVAVKDGALVGFDLGAAMQTLSDGKVPEFDGNRGDKTEFKELTGTFAIADGVAKSADLKLSGPLLRASGAGTVNLSDRSLDYVVRPKVLADSASAGDDKAVGIEVPVHVTGGWDEPRFAPDIGGAINNPGTVEAVKELGKKLKGKKASEVLDDLLRKPEDGQPSKAERLLQKFLKPKDD